jgi:hypothetical protein
LLQTKTSHEEFPWLAVLFEPDALQVRQYARPFLPEEGIKKPRGMNAPVAVVSGS